METLDRMEYQTGYESPRPTMLDRVKDGWDRFRAEWRILGVFFLLIVTFQAATVIMFGANSRDTM
jgi:hypothetical protein